MENVLGRMSELWKGVLLRLGISSLNVLGLIMNEQVQGAFIIVMYLKAIFTGVEVGFYFSLHFFPQFYYACYYVLRQVA